jgi:hypothetical protein
MPSFVRSHHDRAVDTTIMEVNRMEESRRPKCSREARAVEKDTNRDSENVIPFFYRLVLRCIVGASGFNAVFS